MQIKQVITPLGTFPLRFRGSSSKKKAIFLCREASFFSSSDLVCSSSLLFAFFLGTPVEWTCR